MTDSDPNEPRKLSKESKEEALRRILKKRSDIAGEMNGVAKRDAFSIPESHYKIEKFSDYQTLTLQQSLAKKVNLESPYFQEHDVLARNTTVIGGREFINFGTYNYLDLNGDPRVNDAAYKAMVEYGTSAPRAVVSGERRPHQNSIQDCRNPRHPGGAHLRLGSRHERNDDRHAAWKTRSHSA